MMAIFGLADQTDQIVEAIKSGDSVEITVRFVQLICMLFGISSQCFTGETLVSTENGFVQISEINVGDYVWTENVETGEKELKQVLQVYVNETDTLVHLSITDENGSETTINTTENHPFYTEGKGWVTASKLEIGDILHTKDGKIQVVKEVSLEKLEAPVKVYNLEVDEQHTYFVSRVGVLVHNECKVEGGGHGANQHHKDTINAKIEELKKQDDVVAIWGNRALNTAGLKGRQQPDITVLRINAKNQKIYQIFEYASPSQANGTRGYRELDKKIQIMKTNNQSTDENLIIEFLDIFKWGDY